MTEAARSVITLVGLFLSLSVYGQHMVEGKIISLPAKEPLAFVNIGILNSSVGTISNEDGSYSINIPPQHIKDSVIFSALGFLRIALPVSFLIQRSPYNVFLQEITRELETVTIKGDSWKKRKYKFGNIRLDGSCLYADTVTAGSAIALLVKVKDQSDMETDFPLIVKEARLAIVDNTFGEFKVRTRLYEVDPVSGRPGKDILEKSVITRTDLENGNLKVDLSEFNIKIFADFFLAFEWILDRHDRKNLFEQYREFEKQYPDQVTVRQGLVDGQQVPFITYVGLTVGPTFGVSLSPKARENHVCYYRYNSFGRWERSASILSASVLLTN